MEITYRRTGGIFAIVAIAATLLAVVVGGAILLVTVSAVAAVGLLVRAVLPSSWRTRRVSEAAAWPHQTIDHPVLREDNDTKATIL
jgi:hypothetical protein